MKSDEAKIAEAVASLRTRLEGWGVEEAADKAHTYVHDMLRNGWRPRSREVELPPLRASTPATDPTPHIAAARAALRRPDPAAHRGTTEQEDA